MGRAGIFEYVEYGKESAYGTAVAAGAGTRAFGMDQRITTRRVPRNVLQVGDLNSVLVQKFGFGNFEGAVGVEWVVSNPWWHDLILGDSTDAVSGGQDTHTYDDSKTVNSITIETGFQGETANVVRRISGCVMRSISLSTAIGQFVRARGDFVYGKKDLRSTTLDTTIQTDDITFPYTMAQAKLEMPSGTTLAEVQSLDLTLNANTRLIFEPNSEEAVNAYKGKLEISGRFNLAVKDVTQLDNILNRTPTDEEIATLRITFDNTLADPSTKKIEYTITGVALAEHNQPADQYELELEELSWIGRDIQVIATDQTTTPP